MVSPQRKSLNIKVPADKAQGKGAFVIFKGFTWGERKNLQATFRAIDKQTVDEKGGVRTLTDEFEKIIIERLVEWNFVMDDGTTMPLPHASADFDCLNDAEINFLFDTIQGIIKGALGQDEKAKN